MVAYCAAPAEPFGLEEEVVALLRCLSEEQLSSFAEAEKGPASDEQVEHYIYTLFVLFTETRAKKSLELAIQQAEGWIAVVSPDHPDVSRRLKILDMMKAMITQLSLIDGDGAYDVDFHILHLCKRAAYLTQAFRRTGAVNSINEAISTMEQAGEMGQEGHIRQPTVLSNLSVVLGMRFERTGSMDDINRAVEVAGQAVDATPQDHPDRGRSLSNFGVWLVRLFERTGSMDDLNRAVDIAGQAVDATPQDHPNRSGRLNNLGTCLVRRFERTGSMDDLNRAVDVAGQAVDATLQGHTDRATILTNLGNMLGRRFNRTGSMNDLSRAVEVADKAVDATPQDHPDRAGWLSNFGVLLVRQFERTGSMNDLDRAVDIAGQAVDATPQDHPDRGRWLNNRGNWLGKRFERTGSMDDLNRAVEAARKAVDATPQGHPDRATILGNLGNWLGIRFERTGSKDDLSRQLSSYKAGWHCHTAAPSIRIRLARQAARILATELDWEGSSHLLQEAVNLLPTISPRWLKHTDKQHMLTDFAGLASTAASTVLNAQKDAYDALRLLELGRGVIASLLMEMRGDISDLQKQHADLADEFVSLRDELDEPADSPTLLSSTRDSSSWESRAKRRREADEKLGELISRIRAQPTFENFLLPPTTDELMAAASLGPVIVINLSPYRCDAFLLERHQIRVLELPGLTLEGVQERARELRSFPSVESYHATPLLEWLWDVAARPVLDTLGFDGPVSEDNWPHVWWVPTGFLSQLPLHAAGYHTRGGHATVLDRVTSSYASSVKALIHGRQLPVKRYVGPLSEHALLVGMRETPGLSAKRTLPFVADEVEIVQRLCPSLQLRPIRPALRKDDVLKHLQACRIFHFAGHGQSDPDEPSRSCLLLEDWKTKPLTVGDIRDHRLQETPPFLGFLSACSTGANKVDGLVDEGIHLVSAFQLAGFRHVVGTLWEVSDQHCVDVARVLYETMRDEGMTDVAVCRGLHLATRALRSGDIGARSTGRESSPTRSSNDYSCHAPTSLILGGC